MTCRVGISNRAGRWTWRITLVPLIALVLCTGCQQLTLQKRLQEGQRALEQKQPAKAHASFEQAAKESENDPDVLQGIAESYLRAGRATEAEPWMERLSRAKLTPEERNRLATLYEFKGQREKACREWKRAADEAPKDGVIINNYAYSCLVDPGKELDRAIALLNQAIKSTGEKAFVIDSLGWAYYQRFQQSKNPDDLQKSIELLQSAVEKEPGNTLPDADPTAAALRYHLGRAYMAALDWDSAYVELMKANSLDPALEPARIALDEVRKHRQSGPEGDQTL